MGFTPKMAVSAQAMNYVQNANATNDQRSKDLHTATLNFVGQTPALNFTTRAITGSMNYAMFNAVYNSWILLGLIETAVETFDNGQTFGASIVAAAGSSEECVHGDSDPSGNAVIATAHRYIFQRAKATGTVTRVDVLGTTPGNTPNARVVYNPISGKWIWIDVANNAAKTSTDRTTWTTGTTTAPFTTAASTKWRMAINKATGTIVYVIVGSNVRVRRSTNDGTTWSTTVDLSTPVTDADSLSLVCVDDGTWLIACGDTTTKATRVYRSTDDGATWTQVSSLTTVAFTGLAAMGELWVALAKGVNPTASLHDVVWSTDRGVTWTKAGASFDGASGIHSGGGGFVVTTTGQDKAYFSLRMGAPSLGVVT